MEEGEYKTPGEVLGWASDYVAGSGTYVRNQKVYASVVGRQRVLPSPPDSNDQIFSEFVVNLLNSVFKPTIEVRRERERGAVPEPGAIVTAKITKIQPRTASADIVCVGLQAIKEKFTGIVRQQDVRATEIDKVEMHTSFRPGDIIRAEVLSLGDARAYYLSTAKNELGVVSATSDAGVEMVPVSWQEMQCPVTGQKEFRKVAKVT
ncbi:unnamed protein product [Calypogeia fissa]